MSEEQKDSEPEKQVVLKFSPLQWRILEVLADYDNLSVEDSLADMIAEMVQSWGEGMDRTDWAKYFPKPSDDGKEEA